ncbi:MAG: cytochrome C oxidase subunit IV family protein [Actinomycetota bacterium]
MTAQVPPAGAQTERPDVEVRERPVPHPSPRDYVRIGVALALVTLLEVALYYVPGLPDAVLIGSLIILMVVKFALVGLWFMHLKFDSRLYMRLFVAGLVLALSVFVVAFGLAFGA